jgi:hypothetical protein
MKSAKWLAMMVAMVIGFAMVTHAEESASDVDKPKSEKAEKAAKADKPEQPKTYRLIAPYNKLPSLTDEQQERLKAIHGRYLEQIKVLQQQEKDEMMAVLTDEQKSELQQIDEQEKAARKAQAAEKREQEKQKAREAQEQAE